MEEKIEAQQQPNAPAGYLGGKPIYWTAEAKPLKAAGVGFEALESAANAAKRKMSNPPQE